MIAQFQQNYIMRNIIESALFNGKYNTDYILKQYTHYMRNHGNNIPIFIPKYFGRMEEDVAPERWNNSIKEIASDVDILYESLSTIALEIQYRTNQIEDTVKYIKSKIRNSNMLLNGINTTKSNGISLVPDYINQDTSETNATIVVNKDIILPGSYVDIFRKVETPLKSNISVISTHLSFNVNNKLSSIFNSNSNKLVVTISTKEPIPQKIEIDMTIGFPYGGLYIDNDSDIPLTVTTNMSNDKYVLYDTIILINKNKLTNIKVQMEKYEYNDIINGYYIYRFEIERMAFFRNIGTKVSVVTTNDIQITEPYTGIFGNFSGDVTGSISINNNEYKDISFNELFAVTQIKESTSSNIDTNPQGLVRIAKDLPDIQTIDIIGPYDTYEYNGIYYESYLDLKTEATITAGTKDIILQTEYNSITVNKLESKLLSSGVYKLQLTSTVSPFTLDTDQYEIYIKNEYYRSLPVTEGTSYPKYLYMYEDNNLYISQSSLSNVYSNDVQLTVSVSAEYLKIKYTDSVDINAKFRFYLEPNSAISNLRLITSLEK